jgi:multidrug transporter EmrE-like cation transporter
MAWFWLSEAVIFEAIATMALKLSEDFSKLLPSTLVFPVIE